MLWKIPMYRVERSVIQRGTERKWKNTALAGKRSEQLFEWEVVGRRNSVCSLLKKCRLWHGLRKALLAKVYTLDFLFKRSRVHSSYLPLLALKHNSVPRNRINADTDEDREERKQLTKTAVSSWKHAEMRRLPWRIEWEQKIFHKHVEPSKRSKGFIIQSLRRPKSLRSWRFRNLWSMVDAGKIRVESHHRDTWIYVPYSILFRGECVAQTFPGFYPLGVLTFKCLWSEWQCSQTWGFVNCPSVAMKSKA